MMRRLRNLLRKDRILRFFEVWRTEGRKAAIKAATRHSRMLLVGQTPSVVAHNRPSDSPHDRSCALTDVWTELAQKNAFHVTTAPAVLRRRRSVAMIGDLNLPQCRKYRVEQLDEIWAAAGVDYAYAHYEDVPRCLDILQSATHLMLYRLGTSPVVEMYLYEARRLRLPVIYDIDDPLFSFSAYETYSNGAAIPPALRRSLIDQAPAYFAVMQQADALTLSTPGMVDAAGQMSSRPAYLRRNFADRTTLDAGLRYGCKRTADDGFTAVFASGSSGHEVDLLSIADPLEMFLRRSDIRRLKILGRFELDRLPDGLRSRAILEPFKDYPAYLASLARADCAILPLVDDAFNRCKSAVRVIDAASVGLPSVVGSTGDGTAMVRHGETGMIAAADGWYDALERLARNPDRTSGMGMTARRDLETRWSAHTAMPILEPSFISEIVL
ncbi:MAG: hypothetical protein AAGM21_07735 [Pseudomonadota bacterium]